MIHKRSIILILFLALGLFTCDDPQFPIPKEYPIAINRGASDINSTGATLNAELIVPDGEDVLEFGFRIQDDNIVFEVPLESWKESEDFSYRLTSNMIEGKEYLYRPYATTTNYEILGDNKPFVSKGALSPEIIDFSPKTATIQTTIDIIGRNFDIGDTKVFFPGSGRAGTLNSPSKLIKGDVDTLRVVLGIAPLESSIENINITSGETSLSLGSAIQLLEPELSGLSVNKVFMEESPVTLSFNNYNPDDYTLINLRSANNNQADNESVELLSTSDNSISFITGNTSTPGTKNVLYRTGLGYELEIGPLELVPRWEQLTEFPGSALVDFFTGIGSKAYALAENALWKFDLTSQQWVRLANYPAGGNSIARLEFKLGTNIYVGSKSGSKPFYKFDSITETWVQLGNHPYDHGDYRLQAIIDNKLHMIVPGSATATYYVYDPAMDSWNSSLITMPGNLTDLTGRGPQWVQNDLLHFATNPSDGKLRFYTADFSGSSPQFNETVVFDIPEFEGSRPENFGGVAIQTDQFTVIKLKSRISQFVNYSYAYDMSTQSLTRFSGYITSDLISGFNHEGDTYGMALNVGATYNKGLVRLVKTLD